MAIKKYISCEKDGLTKKQKKGIKEATKMPIVFDDDCPKLTKEELSKFRRITDISRNEKQRQ